MKAKLKFTVGEWVMVTDDTWFSAGEVVEIVGTYRGDPWNNYWCRNRKGQGFYIMEYDLASLERHDEPLKLIEDLMESKDREIKELREQLDSIREILRRE